MPRRRTNLERLQVGAWRELLDVVDVRILRYCQLGNRAEQYANIAA